MTLTSAQVTAVRRFAGYSVAGNDATQQFRELVYTNVSISSMSIEYRLANLSADEESVVTDTYLTNLALREQEIQAAAANLDTDEAAVWKHNKQEVSDRRGLFNSLRRELCTFLGIPPGPALAANNRVVRC